MTVKKFMDVPVGSVFQKQNESPKVKYTKISEERISCCQAINARSVDNPQQRIQVLPLEEVEVLE